MSPEEFRAVLARVRTDRGRLFLELLGRTGARVTEALLIEKKHLEESGVYIPTMKRRISCSLHPSFRPKCPACIMRLPLRFVPLPSGFVKKLKTFAEGQTGSRLFPRSRKWAWQLIRGAAIDAGVDRRKAHPHAVRHMFCIEQLKAGVPVGVVRQWMGHVSLATTSIYAEITQSMHNFKPVFAGDLRQEAG